MAGMSKDEMREAKRWRRNPYYSLNDEEMEKLADFYKSLGLL